MDTKPLFFLVVTPRDHTKPSRETIDMPESEALWLAHLLRGLPHVLFVRVLPSQTSSKTPVEVTNG